MVASFGSLQPLRSFGYVLLDRLPLCAPHWAGDVHIRSAAGLQLEVLMQMLDAAACITFSLSIRGRVTFALAPRP